MCEPTIISGAEAAAPGMVVDGDMLGDLIADVTPRTMSDAEAQTLAGRALDEAVRRGMTVLHGPALTPRALPPAPPLAVGDRVETAADLDRLPVGAVVHDADGYVCQSEVGGRWYPTGGADPVPQVRLPARVLDLPTGSS